MKHHINPYESYLIGFALSIILTVEAYFAATRHVFGGYLTYILLGLAIAQLLVQLVFFLHLGQESKPYSNLTVFLITVSVVLVIVVGSLWIMNNLNYNHLTSQQQSDYIQRNEGF